MLRGTFAVQVDRLTSQDHWEKVAHWYSVLFLCHRVAIVFCWLADRQKIVKHFLLLWL